MSGTQTPPRGDLTAVNPAPKSEIRGGSLGGKNKTVRARTDMDAAEVFKHTVCAEPCIGENIDGHDCDGPLQAMHVVPKQTLRRRGLAHLIWDPINAVAGCYRLHRRHDLGVQKIPRALLPNRCTQWAAEHHLTDALERHWPAAAVPYPQFCRHPEKCEGRSSCPRERSCCD